MRLATFSYVFFCAFCAAGLAFPGSPSQGPAADFDPQAARGNISQVVSANDPSQSYAVYLPSRYSTERLWPIIYAFDPFARGKTAAEVYKDAAEKYGYIVAGSNNSRNGPVAEQLAAAQAMWLDTHRRFAIDKNRIYTTGLSGGARVATSFALYCYTCKVAGVVAHGAGYPVMQNAKQPANDHFIYYAAIGDEDFNYPEIMALRKKKDDAGASCKVKIYPGPHQWAPPEIVEDAIEWLELKAMQTGTEKVDPAFVREMSEKTQAEAAQAEQRGDTLTQYYALRSLVADFQGLEDTGPSAGKLAGIKGSRSLKNAERNQQREIEEQGTLTATAAGELAQFGTLDSDAQPGAARHIASVMLDLHRKANSTSSDHKVYSRAYTQLWIQGLEAGQDAFRENRASLAAAYFELMADAAPDQAWPLLLLAEARVRAGNKKAALKAIEQAVQRGLKRAQTLTQDPELQPLASDPEFQRIVQGLSR
jgi:dienelactone hydrolase